MLVSCKDTPRGTTSACAENTKPEGINTKTHGNYLRVRGEYMVSRNAPCITTELPPRARRIPVGENVGFYAHGTTSACAENTRRRRWKRNPLGNYLRVRGEYEYPEDWLSGGRELPPRARRIPNPFAAVSDRRGTTSACAENTLNELGLL